MLNKNSYHLDVYRARAEKAFWIFLTFRYGVTVSYDMYVTCCVKTEVTGVMEMPLVGGSDYPKPQCGHLDKDSMWTLMWVGLLPTVGHRNSELRSSDTWAWLYQGSPPEPCRTSPPDVRCHCSHLACDQCPPLHLLTLSVTGLCAGHLLCSLLSHKLPCSVRSLHRTPWLIAEVSPTKPGIVNTNVCERLFWELLSWSRQSIVQPCPGWLILHILQSQPHNRTCLASNLLCCFPCLVSLSIPFSVRCPTHPLTSNTVSQITQRQT